MATVRAIYNRAERFCSYLSLSTAGSSWRRRGQDQARLPGAGPANPPRNCSFHDVSTCGVSRSQSATRHFAKFKTPSLSPTFHVTQARRHPLPRSTSAMATAYSAYHGNANGAQYTVTSMGRWSSLNKPLPGKLLRPPSCLWQRLTQQSQACKLTTLKAASKIRALHVYDFDNTCMYLVERLICHANVPSRA